MSIQRIRSTTMLLVVLTMGAVLVGPIAGQAEEADHADAHASDGEGDHDETRHVDEEAIQITPEVLEEFGIGVATAGPGTVVRTVDLPAEVRPNQDRLAHIVPRYAGIVKEVRTDIGDRVRAGEVLAVIESSGSLSPFPLKTLIDGVVIAKHITRGEAASPERTAFAIADLRDVWVDISVYQKHLPLLRIGQQVHISAGHELDEADATISYLAPVVDEGTRTATARVVLPNPHGTWRPGLFVTARVEVERAPVAVAVPRTALEVVDDRTVVFVEEEQGYVPRAVTLGRAGRSTVEVSEGLAAGERYVSRGGFTLKAELAREELSSGHSH